MVDLKNSDLEKLPPAERVKKLREIEAQKKRELSDELVKKKKELEELEKKTKEELSSAESLEQETLEEISREEEREALEERVKKFRESKEFVSETGNNRKYEVPQEGRGAGQSLYQSERFAQAQQGIDYLLNAQGVSDERKIAKERDLYQSVRDLAAEARAGAIDESYAAAKLQEQVQHLRERTGEDAFGYVARIENVLNSIIDYRQEDERRKHR